MTREPRKQPPSSRTRLAIAAGMLAAVLLTRLLVPVGAALPVVGLPASPALAQKVVVEAEGVPVGDLLALVAKKTGVPLSADAAVADDKVIVFGPARSLRDVLTDLAALFNDQWEVRKTSTGRERYLLVRSRKAREYEDGLTAAMRDRIIARMDEQARLLSAAPANQRAREADPGRPADSNKRLAARLYTMLGPSQRQALFGRGRLSLSFAALPPQEQVSLRKSFADLIRQQEAVAAVERKAGWTEPVNRPEDLDGAALRFQVRHLQPFSALELLVGRSTVTIARVDGWIRWLLPARGDPYSGDPLPEDVSLPSLASIRAASGGSGQWPDRLRHLAKVAGLPFMADYYRTRGVTGPLVAAGAAAWKLPSGTTPAPAGRPLAGAAREAADALDAFSQAQGYLWWMRSESLLLRKRDWYYQRLYEVPDRWLLTTAGRLQARHGVPTYGDVLGVLDLTPEQLVGLNSFTEPRGEIVPWNAAHELLALIRLSPIDPGAPLPAVGQMSREAWSRTWIRYRDLDARQRMLLPAFLETYPYPLSAEEAGGLQLRIFHDPKPRTPSPEFLRALGVVTPATDPNYRFADIQIGFQIEGETRLYVRFIHLPLSLPDDRRGKTKVEAAAAE